MHPPCFPPTVHDPAPPSLPRVRWMAFPCFDGTMKCSDSLPPFPPHFVSFAWRYHPLRLSSSLLPSPTPTWGRGVLGLATPTRPVHKEMETTGPPKFLGNPLVPTPCSWTPARPTYQAITVVRHGPRAYNDEGSPREVISGLDRTASALAVYASPRGSPHRTQDSLLAAGQLYQTGLVTRRVPTKGFRDVSYIASPFPKLLGQMYVPNPPVPCGC